MVTIGPSTATGGRTIVSREPSGNRASSTGSLKSTRRPTLATKASIALRRWFSSSKRRSVSRTRPSRSTKIASGPLIMISVRLGSFSNGAIGWRAPEGPGSAVWRRLAGAVIIGLSVTVAVRDHIGRMAPLGGLFSSLDRNNPHFPPPACGFSFPLGGRVGVGNQTGCLERLWRRRRKERDCLLYLRAPAFRTGVLFFTLRVVAHHLESVAALRAVELVDRHGAPPEP